MADSMSSAARRLWVTIETIHAVTYFTSESIDAAKAAVLREFWMGYFGFRASPLGAGQEPSLVQQGVGCAAAEVAVLLQPRPER